MGAIMLAYGMMTALVARERYGIGKEVKASNLGSMIALQGLNVSSKTILGHEFPRSTRDDAYNPLWNHYKCADGKWLAIGILDSPGDPQGRAAAAIAMALGAGRLLGSRDPRAALAAASLVALGAGTIAAMATTEATGALIGGIAAVALNLIPTSEGEVESG